MLDIGLPILFDRGSVIEENNRHLIFRGFFQRFVREESSLKNARYPQN